MKTGGFKAIAAMIQGVILGSGAYARGSSTLASMGLGSDENYVGRSKNGGRRLGNAHVQRAARKARNVRRFRSQNRGRA